MLESIQDFIHDASVVNKYAVKTADYSMTVRDMIVCATATDAQVTITLPSVAAVRGKVFTIIAKGASVTYPVVIQDQDDARGWGELGGDISLTHAEDYVVLQSNGMGWQILGTSAYISTRKRVYKFEDQPLAVQSDGTAASGVAGETNILSFSDGNLQYTVKGTQTILCPQLGTGGLDIGMDQTDNDGLELTAGITSTSPAAFVVGTDKFYAKAQFSIATVAGTDDCAFGFRKAEASQTNLDDYDEMAAFNIISGDIKTETILNGGDTTTTDTTDDWADAETHELEVRVALDGTVSYLLDGLAPTAVAATAFEFDEGEIVVPFLFMLQATAAQTGAVILKHFEYGLM